MSKDKPAVSANNPVAGVTKGRGIKGFYNDVLREAKQVTWPTPQETNRLTITVILLCVTVTIGLWALSTGFDTLIKTFIRRG